jgi:hypothetical protein
MKGENRGDLKERVEVREEVAVDRLQLDHDLWGGSSAGRVRRGGEDVPAAVGLW